VSFVRDFPTKERFRIFELLQRDMAESRRLSHLPRTHLRRRVAGKLGVLLLKLGSQLKQFEQSHTPL